MGNTYGVNFNDNEIFAGSWPYLFYRSEIKGTADDDHNDGYEGGVI
ncbi:MAG: hypothetical protein JSR32_00190 [Proteobacteria bacterium]|nr:hypothetical protein [Pseudomonadota bacterium]